MSKLFLSAGIIMAAGLAVLGMRYFEANNFTATSFVVPTPTVNLTDRTTISDPNASPVSRAEHGPETACSTDEDCRCRVFTGVEFVPGSSIGQCCRETNDFNCPELNHCARCLYH